MSINLSLSDTIADLFDDRFDLAVRMGHLKDSTLACKKLADLQRIVVASPEYINQHGTPKHPNDLLHHNCLRWDGPLKHLNTWPFTIDGKEVSITVDGNFQCISGIASTYMCLAHLGIGRMAEHLALPAIDRGELVPLLQEFQARDDLGIYLVFMKERVLPPRIRAFVDFVTDHFKNPSWRPSQN
ncbi:substrate binding domain-containing protein [Kineobactrum salinum]|uniref:substrate binding domain-containing protein n=1 Tax=Kineobactrum salinum TaxID=2708301 RepID=UPI0018D6AF92|nr:substrate binding domain-containing protein [Kineobactrum salinum]